MLKLSPSLSRSEAPVDSGLDPEMPDDFVMDSEIIIDGQRILDDGQQTK